MDGLAKGTLMRGTLSARRRQRAGGGLSGTIGSRSVGSWKAHRGKCWLLYARCDARVLVTRRDGSGEVFEYTAVEVIIHFYGVREAGEVFIHRAGEVFIYRQRRRSIYIHHAGEVFIHFSGAGEAGEVFIYRPTLMQYLSGAEESHSSI